MSNIRTVIFPMGGLGTRFLPATKAIPKEMLPINGIPLIQYAVQECIDAGIERFIFVLSRGKTSLIDHFDDTHPLIQELASRGDNKNLNKITRYCPESWKQAIIRQTQPLGLGHAIWSARNLIHEPAFLVALPDDLVITKKSIFSQMLENYSEGSLIAVEEQQQVQNYGVIAPGDNNDITHIVEKPKAEDAPSNLCVFGRYILDANVFKHLDKLVTAGGNNEIQLTDAIAKEISYRPVKYFKGKHRRFDCGVPEGWLQANIYLSLMHDEDSMLKAKLLEIINEF